MPAFCLNPVVDLHWRVWETECVAYEATSGATTVVDVFESALLACLEGGPLSLTQLVEALASDLQQAPDLPLSEYVQSVVEQFLARGWLKAIDSAG